MSRRPALHQIARLRENPRVAQHAAADVDAAHARLHPRDDVFGLDAVAGSEHRNRNRPRDLGDEIPIGKAAVALLRGAAVNGDRLRARVLDALRQLAAR